MVLLRRALAALGVVCLLGLIGCGDDGPIDIERIERASPDAGVVDAGG